jgi:Restriction endonuclease
MESLSVTHQDSDDEHEVVDPTPLQWKMYERQVCNMLDALDPGADVQHDVHITGDLSGTPRQVDIKVTGTLAGQQITIAVECKRYSRPIGIGTVDEFAGKLLDLNVDRGVLFALNGLTEPARKRAKGARNPKIEVGDLIIGPLHLDVDIDRLFKGFGDCPNENCYTGDIYWRAWHSDHSDQLRAGACSTCGTWAVECPECEEIVGFYWDESICICNAKLSIVRDYESNDIEEISVTSDEKSERIYSPA